MVLNRANILPFMPKASDSFLRVKTDFDTSDIISTILAVSNQYVSQTATIAKSFASSTIKKTAQNIFDFLMSNITYKVDPSGSQFVKVPSQLISDGFGDCKSLSLFTASVLHNLGIPYAFRFVSFGATPKYTHVYIICGDMANPILIDRVWKRFDSEKKYTFNKDFWVYPKSKKQFSGIGSIGDIGNSYTYNHEKALFVVSGIDNENAIGRAKKSKARPKAQAVARTNAPRAKAKSTPKSVKTAAANLFGKKTKVATKNNIAEMAAKGRKLKAEQIKQKAKALFDNAQNISKIVNEKGQFVDKNQVLYLKYPIKSDVKYITDKGRHYDVFVAELNRNVKFPRTNKKRLLVANGFNDFPYHKWFRAENGYIALDNTKVVGENKYALVHRDDFANMLKIMKSGLTPRRKNTVELEKYYKAIGNEEMAEAVVKYGPDSVGTGVLKALETGFDVITTGASFIPGAGAAFIAVKGGVAAAKAGIKAGVKAGIKSVVKKGLKTGAKKVGVKALTQGGKKAGTKTIARTSQNLFQRAKTLKNSKFVTKAKKLNKLRTKAQENINRFMPQNAENENEIYQKPMMYTENSDNHQEQENISENESLATNDVQNEEMEDIEV